MARPEAVPLPPRRPTNPPGKPVGETAPTQQTGGWDAAIEELREASHSASVQSGSKSGAKTEKK